MNELDLINSLVAEVSRQDDDVVIGPGEDDAAAWREPDGGYAVASCDTSVEGIHFDLARQEPEDIGWRALAFALGDLAAKGAKPSFGLASISIPTGWAEDVPRGIYRGLAELASEVGLRLVGGDTTAAPHDGSLTVAVLGRSERRPLARSSVQAGWCVGVTGPLGGAGLHWKRPMPRLELGAALAERGLVCGDISDGLLREMDKVCVMARKGSVIRLGDVPVASGSSATAALASGEEVELVVMGPRDAFPAHVTVVGELIAEPRVVVLDERGQELNVRERGYDHFA